MSGSSSVSGSFTAAAFPMLARSARCATVRSKGNGRAVVSIETPPALTNP